MTKEVALHSDDKAVVYAASKKYAELAVWEWEEAHPDVDVTTSQSYYSSPQPCLTNLIEQYFRLLSTVHSHVNIFHFRSQNMTPFPLLS